MVDIDTKTSNRIASINSKKISKGEFVKLLEENKISLYRFGKSILKKDVEVEDAIGETILKAYKYRKRLKNIEKFKSWIMSILSNECYNILKRNKKFDLLENLEELNLVSSDEKETSLRDIVENLSVEFSSVIVLFYYEDMSIKNIGEILNISEGTVKSRLNRARKKLKVLLNRQED